MLLKLRLAWSSRAMSRNRTQYSEDVSFQSTLILTSKVVLSAVAVVAFVGSTVLLVITAYIGVLYGGKTSRKLKHDLALLAFCIAMSVGIHQSGFLQVVPQHADGKIVSITQVLLSISGVLMLVILIDMQRARLTKWLKRLRAYNMPEF